MDRYVIREQRSGNEFPEGNQMIAFSATSSRPGNNITIPENSLYYSYGAEMQNTNVQQLGTPRLVTPHGQTYPPNVVQAQGQIVSGIDPRYLAEYGNNNAGYVQTMHGGNITSPAEATEFGSDYQNRNFIGAVTNNRNFNKAQANNQIFNGAEANNHNNFNRVEVNNNINNNPNFNGAPGTNLNFNRTEVNNLGFNKNELNNQNFNRVEANNRNLNRNQIITSNFNVAQANSSFSGAKVNNAIFNKNDMHNQNFNRADTNNNFNRGQENNRNFNGAGTNIRHFKGAERNENKLNVPQIMPKVASKKHTEIDLLKHELQSQVKTRAEKLKELQKSGTRVFSGPVEKILKWHKSIQDIGAMVFYEIVGKCVTVRAVESCAKNLVVRDENGPAIQIVYYEIDFLLPELKPPCMVRVIGRMMPGTTRFQAFNVRPATGDDVATLPRRAAVAAHHVAKLSKEYGVEVLTLK